MNIDQLLDRILGGGLPPTIHEVKMYFEQKGFPPLEAEHFFLLHSARGWRTRKGKVIRNWRIVAYQWILSAWLSNPMLFDRHAR